MSISITFRIFFLLSLALQANLALSAEQTLCPVTSDQTVEVQIKNYLTVNKKLQSAARKQEAEKVSYFSSVLDSCAYEIAFRFNEIYFLPAYQNKEFNAKEYEENLEALDAIAHKLPEGITKIVFYLQQFWDASFLRNYLFIAKKQLKNTEDKTLGTLYLATFLIPAGPKLSGAYLNVFKSLPIIRSTSNIIVKNTVKWGASAATHASIGIGGYITNQFFSNLGIHFSGHEYDLVGSTEGLKEIKEFPIAPAQKLSLIGLPEDLIKLDLTKTETWKKISQEAIQFGGVVTALFAIRSLFNAAKLAAMPCLPAFAISLAVGFAIEEATAAAEDNIELRTLQSDLKQSIDEFHSVTSKQSSIYEDIQAANKVVLQTQKLQLYYRLKMESEGQVVSVSTPTITYQSLIGLHDPKGSLLNTLGDLDIQNQMQFIAILQKLARNAFAEQLYRAEEKRKLLETLSDGKKVLGILKYYLFEYKLIKQYSVQTKSETPSNSINSNGWFAFRKTDMVKLLENYSKERDSLQAVESVKDRSDEELNKIIWSYAEVENILIDYKNFLNNSGISFNWDSFMQNNSTAKAIQSEEASEELKRVLLSEGAQVQLGISDPVTKRLTLRKYPNREYFPFLIPTQQEGLFALFLESKLELMKEKFRTELFFSKATQYPDELLLQVAFYIQSVATKKQARWLNLSVEKLLTQVDRSFFSQAFGAPRFVSGGLK